MTRSSVLQECLGQPLARYSPLRRITESDGLVGWGNKANSAGLEAKAKSAGIPFIRLEDGFIGYTGHPANG
ncbi:MAG: capsular polysaccharide biosynthesis protein, partial [Shewanella sp.]|nr:capsular polysaccharide biosynthesis protein [Shewanella sp.]